MTESWYKDKKSSTSDEAEHIVKTAAQLLKNAIKNHQHDTDYYPTVNDILCTTIDHLPGILKVFVSELITSSLKQMSISEDIFSATRTRSVMPLQLGLAIAADNQLATKWLNILLNKLGFAVSYNEVNNLVNTASTS